MNNTIKKGLVSGEIKPEFGNPDHIKFLQNHDNYVELFSLGAPVSGEEFTKRAIINIEFECPTCLSLAEVGNTTENVYYNFSGFKFTIEEDFFKKFSCDKCKQEFILHNGIIKTL